MLALFDLLAALFPCALSVFSLFFACQLSAFPFALVGIRRSLFVWPVPFPECSPHLHLRGVQGRRGRPAESAKPLYLSSHCARPRSFPVAVFMQVLSSSALTALSFSVSLSFSVYLTVFHVSHGRDRVLFFSDCSNSGTAITCPSMFHIPGRTLAPRFLSSMMFSRHNESFRSR